MQSEAIVIPDELVRSARSGDPDALASLWERCAPLVSSTLKAALRHHRTFPGTIDRADVAQEAALLFLTLLRESLDDRNVAFPNVFGRALYWRVHGYLRAERRRLGRQVTADHSDLEDALRREASGAPGGLTGRSIVRALERLSPRQRAVVAGLHFRELSVRALARELGVTPQAVTALHRRALASLRTLLAEGEDIESPPKQS